ncbi:hypothetical protein ACLOJK_011721 [Asimina triloba]
MVEWKEERVPRRSRCQIFSPEESRLTLERKRENYDERDGERGNKKETRTTGKKGSVREGGQDKLSRTEKEEKPTDRSLQNREERVSLREGGGGGGMSHPQEKMQKIEEERLVAREWWMDDWKMHATDLRRRTRSRKRDLQREGGGGISGGRPSEMLNAYARLAMPLTRGFIFQGRSDEKQQTERMA